MDWPRAKTILIIAFTLLNVFLVGHLYIQPTLPPLQPSYLAAASGEELAEALAPYGLDVRLSGHTVPHLVPLIVRPRDPGFDPQSLMGGVSFRHQVATVQGVTGRLFTAGDRRLFLGDDGRLIYSRTPVDPQRARPVDVPEAARLAREFIEAHGGLPGDVRQVDLRYDRRDGLVTLRYEQEIPGATAGSLALFDGIIEAGVAGEEVVRYERSLWQVTPSRSAPDAVVPATTLLLRQVTSPTAFRDDLTRLTGGGSVVEPTLTVELGYVLTGRRSVQDGREGYWARPAWRVRLDDQAWFFDASGQPMDPGPR